MDNTSGSVKDSVSNSSTKALKKPVEEPSVFNISDLLLEKLELKYFDSHVQEVPKPDSLDLPSLDESKTNISLEEIKEVLPQIVYPEKKTKETLEPVSQSPSAKRPESGSEVSESDSGSESEDEDFGWYKRQTFSTADSLAEEYDEQDHSVSYLNTRSPLIYLGGVEDQVNSQAVEQQFRKSYTVFKALFDEKEILNPIQALGNFRTQASDGMSAMFMIGGGHFAGAIVAHKPLKSKILKQQVHFIAHKTVHRYTTRRKQGGLQSTMDNSKGKANSAGSTLRRYNEQALAKDIKEILTAWQPYLKHCKNIFVRANTKVNYKLIVDDEIISKTDPRVKGFPFVTKRASLEELKTSWLTLTHLKIQNLPKIDVASKQDLDRAKRLLNLRKQKVVKPAEVISTPKDVLVTNELILAINKGKNPQLMQILRSNKIDVNHYSMAPNEKYNGSGLLHWASLLGRLRLVFFLLTILKADPTLLNNSGQTPWDLAKDDNTKFEFQKARHGNPDAWDWEAAHVGEPLTASEVSALTEAALKQHKDKVNEIIEEEKKAPRDITVKKYGEGKVLPRGLDQQTLVGLSEDERRKVEREKRARAIEARMKKS